MEDLGQAYRRASEQADRCASQKRCPSIHQALADWLPTVEPDHLLHYDGIYAKRLLSYAYENLEAYAERADESAKQLLNQWTALEDVYFAGIGFAQEPHVPIHGDSNPANILVHRREPIISNLIDWEWAGVGLVHADLASLLKRTPSGLEQQALELYAQQNQTFTVAEHRQRYEWCSFSEVCSTSDLLPSNKWKRPINTRVNLSKYVTKSIDRVSVAVDRLRYETTQM